MILVAHSTAGLAARAFAAANPTLVAGLITLGTPHGGAPLSAVVAPEAAEALRAARLVLQSAGEQGSFADAVAHLSHLLDGWQPGPSGAPDRAALPARALRRSERRQHGHRRRPGGRHRRPPRPGHVRTYSGCWRRSRSAPLAPRRRRTSRSGCAGSSTSRPRRPAVSTWTPGSASTRSASGSRPRPSEPPRAAHRVDVDARISRPGDWLLATPSERLRRAELGLTVEMRSADAIVATPRARFYDAAISAPTAPLVELADPMAEELLDAGHRRRHERLGECRAQLASARSTPSGFWCTTTRGPRASRPRP